MSIFSKLSSQPSELEELRTKLAKLEERLDEVEVENFKYQHIIKNFEKREIEVLARLSRLENNSLNEVKSPPVDPEPQANISDDNWSKLLQDEETARKMALKKFRNQRRTASRVPKSNPPSVYAKPSNEPKSATVIAKPDVKSESSDDWDDDDEESSNNNYHHRHQELSNQEVVVDVTALQTASNPSIQPISQPPQLSMDDIVIQQIDDRILAWCSECNSFLDMMTTIRNVAQYLQFPQVAIHDADDNQEIRRSYLSLIRVCHPDKVKPSSTSSSYRLAEANRFFSALSDAYNEYVINSA